MTKKIIMRVMKMTVQTFPVKLECLGCLLKRKNCGDVNRLSESRIELLLGSEELILYLGK